MVSQETDAIAANCNDVLYFLQAVAVKAPRLTAVPLYCRTYKHTQELFRRWSSHHLTPLSASLVATPQKHSGLTGVLSNVATLLRNAEALRPIVTAQQEADTETRVWNHLHPMA